LQSAVAETEPKEVSQPPWFGNECKVSDSTQSKDATEEIEKADKALAVNDTSNEKTHLQSLVGDIPSGPKQSHNFSWKRDPSKEAREW
jgi:hypothetical protein